MICTRLAWYQSAQPNPFDNPLCLEIHVPVPELPSYLLGIPPFHRGAIPVHSDPWLAVYWPPPPFAPHSLFPFPQRFPISNICPSTTTLRYRLHIVRYNSFCVNLLSCSFNFRIRTFYIQLLSTCTLLSVQAFYVRSFYIWSVYDPSLNTNGISIYGHIRDYFHNKQLLFNINLVYTAMWTYFTFKKLKLIRMEMLFCSKWEKQ